MRTTTTGVIDGCTNQATQANTAVLIKVPVLYGDRRVLDVLRDFIGFNYLLVVTIPAVFPKQLIVAIVVACNGGLDAFSKLAWANLVDIAAVIGKQRANGNHNKHHNNTNDFE